MGVVRTNDDRVETREPERQRRRGCGTTTAPGNPRFFFLSSADLSLSLCPPDSVEIFFFLSLSLCLSRFSPSRRLAPAMRAPSFELETSFAFVFHRTVAPDAGGCWNLIGYRYFRSLARYRMPLSTDTCVRGPEETLQIL